MKKCDVIIPVYNAYDALSECINSVIENTNLVDNNLILINDKSTDERILPLLNKIKKKNSDKNIIVLENENNLGFVGTVNVGMKYSNNDVLLLNSDTEVSSNWLDNIKKCAYSGEKIATVTALSNNATLASVPFGLKKNDIPTDYDFAKYAKIVSECSYKDYPELPTAHGFCMYIRRDALDVVGYFDEDAFGKGYGEENDFSYRCLDYGYRNLLCDNVIVYHKESQSFNEKRDKLREEHSKILSQRYPEYVSRLSSWCSKYPIKYIGDNILYSTKVRDKKNILVIIHDWETSTGGTTLHVKDIINGLRDEFNFHVLSYTARGYKLYSYFSDCDEVLSLKYINKYSNLPRYNSEYRDMVEKIVLALNISDIHIHHMINHYFDLTDIINKYKLNASITLHDFYSICPTINLLYEGRTFCGILENKDCAKCLNLSLKLHNNILDGWHKDWERLFASVNNIIVPSEDTKRRISTVYKNINIKVIEHGIDMESYDCSRKHSNKIFNVAYVGVLSNHKGLYIFKDLLKSKGKNIKFHLFGYSEDKKMNRSKGNYIYHGKYNRQTLAKQLNTNNIDLVCFLQIWPETYSYTVQEVIASGIPMISYDIGAGADRIKANNLGWVVPLTYKANDIIKKIIEIKDNPFEYNEKIKAINKYKIKNVKKMNEEYLKIYKTGNNKKSINQEELSKFIKNSYLMSNSGSNEELEAILNSTKWRLVNKINFSPRMTNFIRKIIRRG